MATQLAKTKTCRRCGERPRATRYLCAFCGTHCSMCGGERDGTHPTYCRACSSERTRQWNQAHPERVRAWRKATPEMAAIRHRRTFLKKNYGLTLEDYDSLLASQGGRCAICKTDKAAGPRGHFNVDHCHDTGRVRGLLCHHCNTAIGLAGDDPKRLRAMADYLERATA